MADCSSGIYGAFRLDGGPVDPSDLQALGIRTSAGPGSAQAVGVDPHTPDAIDRDESNGAMTLLVGHLYEQDELADRLNLQRGTPPARLARAALARFGSEAADVLIGEWSLLHWEGHGRLTLMSSVARRDRILFAISGARVAVAPNLFQLARIGWIGDEIDDVGLILGMSSGRLREQAGKNRPMLRGVSQLGSGESVVITTDSVRHGAVDILPPQPRWSGTRADAMVEAETVLRRVTRDRLSRTKSPGVLLSGGLDSSLLAWAACDARSGNEMHLLTSVAPPTSGLPDERDYADRVAEPLGLEIVPVWPADTTNTYRPPDHILGGASGPLFSNRIELTEAFQATARTLGSTLLVNGGYGELGITGRMPFVSWQQQVRDFARQHLRRRPTLADNLSNEIFVRLAPDRLAQLPEAIASGIKRASDSIPTSRPRRDHQWGYVPGTWKPLAHYNEFCPGAVRMDFPFRDVRLLRLFARFPISFFEEDGLDRAPARHILKGRLPDAVRLRTSGMPASPAHMMKLQQQAPAARDRIAEFRKAQVDEWLDLNWLDAALARVAGRGASGYDEANAVQMTVLAAEFLTWFRLRR
jgi:asparagine synthase (glutamine-hydrolysing)